VHLPYLPPAHIVPLSTGEVFVRDEPGAGDRTPVVLVHGWMATADLNFFPLYPALRDSGRRVIAPDLRHHGRGGATEAEFSFESAADELAELLDALEVPKAIVVGYSLGTAVGQTFAARHPDRCAALILCAGALHWRGPLRRAAIWRAGWDGTFQRASRGRWGGRKMADVAGRRQPEVVALKAWLAGELERGHPGGLRSAGRALSRFDARPFTGQVRVPVAVVRTEKDKLVPPKRQSQMAETYGVEPVTLAGGHLTPAFDGPAFVDTVVPLIDQVDPDARSQAAPATLTSAAVR
jgi:pimeloyl-ACP methyl ester carboxylesterase